MKLPRKEGLLDKLSPWVILRGWQSRHVEVKDGIFKYYEHQNGRMVNLGTLNFDLYCCYVSINEKNKNQFKLTFKGNDREFWFKASNELEAANWVRIIRKFTHREICF